MVKSRIFVAIAVLFLPVRALADTGVLIRQASPAMRSTSTTDARAYKNNILLCDDPAEESKVLLINHFNELLTATSITSSCAVGDEDGNASAITNATNKSTCDAGVGDPVPDLNMSSQSEYYTSVNSTAPYYTQGPVFRAEGDASGLTDQSSNFVMFANTSKTLSATYELSSQWPEGETEIEPYAQIGIEAANSHLSAIRLSSDWLVFGRLQKNSTGSPNEPPVDVFYFTGIDEFSIIYTSTEKLTANSTFEARTEESGDLNAISTEHVGRHDETTWKLSAKLKMSVTN